MSGHREGSGRRATGEIPGRVRAVLDHHGLRALTFEPGTTPTSEMAARRIGVRTAQIAKSMVLKGADDSFYLIVCPGDARLSNRKLKKALGVKARMATPEETLAVTGFSPGGVCPFGLTGVEILVDLGLEAHDAIYPAAGTDGSGVPTTFRELCEITGARACDVCDPAPDPA